MNAELPKNSRSHILDQFNRGVVDIVIATDAAASVCQEAEESEEDEEMEGEKGEEGEEDEDDEDEEEGEESEDEEDEEDSDISGDEKDMEAAEREMEAGVGQKHGLDDADEKSPKKRKRNKKEDQSYGVTRGIDFKEVKAVVNFDLPDTYAQYVHRVGRTARGASLCMIVGLMDSVTDR